MKTDSENISALFDKYYQGNISPEEESVLMDYLQNKPNTISEKGFDVLADKLVYEHSLIERKAIFQDMMKNQTSGFSSKHIWGIVISAVVLISGAAYLLNNNTTGKIQESKPKENTVALKSEIKPKTINDSNLNVKPVSPKFNTNNKVVTAVEKPSINNVVSQNQVTISNNTSNIPKEPVNAVKTNKIDNTVNNSSNNQANVSSKPVCPDYSKEVSIITSKTETNAANGSIVLLTQKSNLEFSIDNVNFSNDKRFEHLAVGTYNVTIKDNENCSNAINGILIAETACISEYKKDLIKGQTWQLSIVPSDVKNIAIYNTSGQIVFKKSQDFTDIFEWEGINSQGVELVEGFYKVVISYQKETCIFNVSILK